MKPRCIGFGLAALAMIGLSACSGGDEAGGNAEATTSAKNTQSINEKPVNSYARDLVREEGCDPRVANAIAPYESEYGECSPKRMPRYTELCGEANFDAGLALIDEARAANPGLNPWLWACVRSADLRTALTASCQYRFPRNEETCGCAVDKTLSSDIDMDLVKWMTFTEANDPIMSAAPYEEWASLTSEYNRFEDLQEVRKVYYGHFETCSG